MKQFLIGIDYGTESARGVLLDAEDGALLATHRHAYAHGVLEENLPDGTALPPQWALQDADGYLPAAEAILAGLGASARERGGEIVAIGLDSTASSPLPTLADGTPLSRRHPGQPHAYVKLWKHHSAQPWADRINAAGGDYLRLYGGQTSCEWLPAKAAQIAAQAPALWDKTARFIESGDWIVSQLVGREVRSVCHAGYKAHYHPETGYPEALDALTPRLRERLAAPEAIGRPAGRLTPAIIERTGLPGTPVVAVATVDAHAVVPAVGVADPGTMVCSLGTSACQLLIDPQAHAIPSVAGVVYDGILPGAWGYECGQAGFGDLLGWFVHQFPAGQTEADSFAHYEAAAAALAPGESGVLALDWLNGCRTPLMNPRLSGLFVGMTLQTRPAALYRALLESLCFGTRRILETLESSGLAVDRLVLTSGLAERNPLLNQLMVDITGRAAEVPDVAESTARGAAIHGAVAAGIAPDFSESVARLGVRQGRHYTPRPQAVAVYAQRYGAYRQISERFAEGDEMALLRRLRNQALRPRRGAQAG